MESKVFRPYLALISIILGASLLQLANALFVALLPLRLTLAGDSSLIAGLVAASFGLGFVIGCMRVAKLVQSVGHIRAFATLAATCSMISLGFLVIEEPAGWMALRFAMGFCLAGLFITAEGWLSAATPRELRGSVLSIYLIGTKAATITGQIALAFGDIQSVMFFALCAAIFSMSLIPVALTRQQQPKPPESTKLDVKRLYNVAPAAVVGAVAAGIINASIVNLAAVWGAGNGLTVATIVMLLATMQICSLVLQWPLGWLSDHIDRRLVIITCSSAIAALSMVLALRTPEEIWLLIVLFGSLGAFAMSFYGICIAHAADFAEPGQMIGVSSGLLFGWALGGAIGPAVAGPWMDLLGPAGLFWFTACIAMIISVFIAYRRTRRDAIPPSERDGFINLPATSPRLAEIDPRREKMVRDD